MKVGKPYHHENLRGALLAAALDLIRQKGGSHGLPSVRLPAAQECPTRRLTDTSATRTTCWAPSQERDFFGLPLLRAAVAKDWYPVRRLRNAASRMSSSRWISQTRHVLRRF